MLEKIIIFKSHHDHPQPYAHPHASILMPSLDLNQGPTPVPCPAISLATFPMDLKKIFCSGLH